MRFTNRAVSSLTLTVLAFLFSITLTACGVAHSQSAGAFDGVYVFRSQGIDARDGQQFYESGTVTFRSDGQFTVSSTFNKYGAVLKVGGQWSPYSCSDDPCISGHTFSSPGGNEGNFTFTADRSLGFITSTDTFATWQAELRKQ